MMKLNKDLLCHDNMPEYFDVPSTSLFQLPEKVLQFGTGVLLRGLPDFYIDKANKKNIFNGRIVVVKSTGTDVHEFTEQDSLYTHCIKGLVDGKPVESYIINASISKVFSVQKHWNEIIQYAESEDMQIIISNTTEAGIVLQADDDMHASPPASFPAKLLAFLYRRYKYFNGSNERGMVIIPTELIVENGDKLKEIVLTLASVNKLDDGFIKWLDEANDFCNSLVDRIVPGALKTEDGKSFENISGYADELTIMSEPYCLWAIESSSEKTKELLSFYKADENVIITRNINKYRELKLRLLNGTHTFSCGLAYLAGFDLVYEAMQNTSVSKFIREMMIEEIAPCITGSEISVDETISFADKVIDRFSNPYIKHKWLSITTQYSAKMKMRNVPLLLKWYERQNKIPMHMAAGFAAYILFMKPIEKKGGNFYGITRQTKYKIDDDKAAYFYYLWKENNASVLVEKILSDEILWGTDLTTMPGFSAAVQDFVDQFSRQDFNV